MTVKREFRCNLCGDEIVSAKKPGKHGVGIEFRSASFADTSFVFKSIDNANNHLCFGCIRNIVNEKKSLNDIDMVKGET
jgi:hypothetical protein